MRSGIIASAGAAALVVALVPLTAVTVAAGAAKAKSGPEKVFVTPTSTTSAKHPGKILLTGTVADYGKVVATNAKGKVTPRGEYRQLELKKGTMLVDIASFDEALTKAYSHATFDKTTCSISVSGVGGTITIVSGTKAYAGIKGSFMMTASLAFIEPLKNGACTTKTTTPAVATYTEVTGSGTVSLP